jgi:hypothetical protein
VFGAYKKEMAREQILWREALSRPGYDLELVANSLEQALSHRGLKWELKKYPATRDALDAWAAWATRDAWDALTINLASLNKWIKHPSDLLTTGIRDAYLNGLELAVPVSKDTLGFAVKETK